ncbi:MAG: RagB/SusD family nutrient uptake outer membrane protein, partial [Muribaculaceae bacterium]|nr:RagB/SusD family nutrient uptake outer membrane protein [Muribaculaceae bacterium]
IWNGKWYLPLEQFTEGRTTYGSNNNVRILRYADVLLMNAEAKVRLGENGDTPFNLVRQRANMPELTNVTVDQILDERRMELCCEWGERYTDLVRTGKAASVLGPNGWTVDKTYFPIPQTQLDLAPDLLNEPFTTLTLF